MVRGDWNGGGATWNQGIIFALKVSFIRKVQ